MFTRNLEQRLARLASQRRLSTRIRQASGTIPRLSFMKFVSQLPTGVKLKGHNPHNNTSYDLYSDTHGGFFQSTDEDGDINRYSITNETKNELGFDPQDVETAHFTVSRNSYFKNPRPTNWDAPSLKVGDVEELYAWLADRIGK